MSCAIHLHSEFSTFDGFNKAREWAETAKNLGYTAIGITDHGNTNVSVQHYLACKDFGIKPIIGVEGYFLPKYKEQERGFHLILLAKNHKGYRNINEIQYEGEKQKYYNPIWTFELLEKYHEGVICSTACVAGYLAQMIKENKIDTAKKYLLKLKKIFKDDVYIEIQPYTISEKGLQEKINKKAIELAKELNMKCILTSDAHRCRKEDFETYLKMHEIAGHNLDEISKTYKERYLPSISEIKSRFEKMHKKDFSNRELCKLSNWMIDNLQEIEDKVEEDIFCNLAQTLPRLSKDPIASIKKKIKTFLQSKNKWNEKYIARVNQELKVIETLGFGDYFLMVADYVNWAKENGIAVGPGRGSACNCEVAYCLGITEVDSLLFNLDFRRFLREDKKKMPDIDVDFETSRRHEVIEYVMKKYKGSTARIASYGLYKVDNLINDLAKVSNLPIDIKVDEMERQENISTILEIKTLINSFISDDGELNKEALLSLPRVKEINEKYDNIILHFTKLYKKMRFVGTHAAGVAITGGNILDYSSLRIDKEGEIYTNYDLNDMENINVIKFDMLGLQTMEEINELRKITKDKVEYDEIVNDKNILEEFSLGETQAIFQFDKKSVRDILQKIHCDCFEDIIAANAMNRPGPLSLKMPEQYGENKLDISKAKNSLYFPYTKESYGTIVYQEQIQQICVYLGGMSWGDADKVMKMIGGQSQSDDAKIQFEKDKKEMHDKFLSGALKKGISKKDAEDIFNMVLVYSFNKGHACGYSFLSIEEMYYKVYHPTKFWFCKIKYAPNTNDYEKYCQYAVKNDCVIFIPHVNYSDEKMKLRKIENEYCLQRGLSEIKGVGLKASEYIVQERKKNGIFYSYDNFIDRCKSRVVTSKVINILLEQGALEFNKKIYLKRVKKYNATLYQKMMN